MIPLIAIAIGAYIGYRQWGGARGAILGGLLAFGLYLLVAFILAFGLLFMGGQIEDILSEVGDSI